MLLIVLYHFLEVNAIEDDSTATSVDKAASGAAQAQAKGLAKS